MYQPKRLEVIQRRNKRYLSAFLALTMLLSLLQPLMAYAQGEDPLSGTRYTLDVDGRQLSANNAYTVSPDTEIFLIAETSEESVSVQLPEGLTVEGGATMAQDSSEPPEDLTAGWSLSGQTLNVSLNLNTEDSYKSPYFIKVPLALDYAALAENDGVIYCDALAQGATLTVTDNMSGMTDFQLTPYLYKYDPSAEGGIGEELGGDTGLKDLTEDIIYLFDFHIMNNDVGYKTLTDCGFKTGVRYSLGTLEGLVDKNATAGADHVLNIMDSSDKHKFGELHITASGDIFVIFEDTGCYDVKVGFFCNVAAEAEKEDSPGEFIIQLPGKTVTFPVESEAPKGPILEKTVTTPTDAGVTTWTIKYTPAVKNYAGTQPAKLEDTLPEGLTYVDGSFKAVDESEMDVSSQLTMALTDVDTLTWDLPTEPNALPPGKTITITYQTRFTDDELGELWSNPKASTDYKNTVIGLDKDGNPFNLEDSAELNAGDWAKITSRCIKGWKRLTNTAP